MGNVSLMTGVPWHTEYLKKDENDSKRDKRRCAYYDKNNNHCTHLCSKCSSSESCKYYCETRKKSIKDDCSILGKNASSEENERIKIDEEGLRIFPIGIMVKHEYFGVGRVANIKAGIIKVGFSNEERSFTLYEVYKNRLFTKINSTRKFYISGSYEGKYAIDFSDNGLIDDINEKTMKHMLIKIQNSNNEQEWISICVYVDLIQMLIYMPRNVYSKYRREMLFSDQIKIVEN